MRPAFGRTMWKRNVQLFADSKGMLEAEQKRRTDIAENVARCVEGGPR